MFCLVTVCAESVSRGSAQLYQEFGTPSKCLVHIQMKQGPEIDILHISCRPHYTTPNRAVVDCVGTRPLLAEVSEFGTGDFRLHLR